MLGLLQRQGTVQACEIKQLRQQVQDAPPCQECAGLRAAAARDQQAAEASKENCAVLQRENAAMRTQLSQLRADLDGARGMLAEEKRKNANQPKALGADELATCRRKCTALQDEIGGFEERATIAERRERDMRADFESTKNELAQSKASLAALERKFRTQMESMRRLRGMSETPAQDKARDGECGRLRQQVEAMKKECLEAKGLAVSSFERFSEKDEQCRLLEARLLGAVALMKQADHQLAMKDAVVATLQQQDTTLPVVSNTASPASSRVSDILSRFGRPSDVEAESDSSGESLRRRF